MHSNLQAPVFPNLPFPRKVGIPLPLYKPYILSCLASGVPVIEIHSQLRVIGYLQKYSTFAQYVRKKVLMKDSRPVTSNFPIQGKSINSSEKMKNVEIDLSDLMASNPAISAIQMRKNQRY